MILLDTNVLSELMKPRPSEAVTGWLDAQHALSVYTSSITQAEILHGLTLLPAGRRRASLEAAVETMFSATFGGRVLAFDSDAAIAYARIAARRRRIGRPISQADAQIAAIALSRGASLATRDSSGFEGCEITLVDPWKG